MNSKLQQVRSVIEQTLQEGKVVASSDNSVNEIFPVAIDAAQGRALRDWIVKEKASQTIGNRSWVGTGSSWLRDIRSRMGTTRLL